MDTITLDTLRDAIARNSPGVVSLPSSGMLRHHKTRFLAAQDEGFWIEAPPDEQALIDELIRSAQFIGVALKSATSKIIFTANAIEFRVQMAINKDLRVDAILLSWPEQLKSVQRRADYRVTIPTDSEISAKAWRVNEQHYIREKPPASTQVKGYMRNLSAGGLCMVCQIKPDEPKLVSDQRLRVAISRAGGELVLEARVKYVQPLPNGDFRIGAQFRKLESDLEGRQALAALSQILGLLQREEIRRTRLGLPSVA